MKKLLLFAAAAVAFGASAQTLTQTWKVETANNLPVNDCRQGVGLNGKIYVNNKADQKVYVVDKDGVSATTLPGGANCGIGRDQAGNLLVSNAAFPGKWADDAVIKVYKPQTPETVTEITITADLAGMGRSDFLGSAMGDLSTFSVAQALVLANLLLLMAQQAETTPTSLLLMIRQTPQALLVSHNSLWTAKLENISS